MSKYYLSFHTIFILNENIKWLEEFIIYYKHIGFDHFYLYDNEGTAGYGSTSTVNRYGFPITSETQDEDRKLFNTLIEKYKNDITVVKWQPRNSKGEIEYQQPQAIKHAIDNFGNDTTWMAFLDFDEFIYSEQNINLIEFLKTLNSDVSCVKLIQKKFRDRFLTKEHIITQEFRCINNLKIGTEWAPKNIIRCYNFQSVYNVHNINVNTKTIVMEPEKLRFNHYNINDKQLDWMTDFYKSSTRFEINGIDTGMKRYSHLFYDIE